MNEKTTSPSKGGGRRRPSRHVSATSASVGECALPRVPDMEWALFGKPPCAKGHGDCDSDCEYGLAGPCVKEITDAN